MFLHGPPSNAREPRSALGDAHVASEPTIFNKAMVKSGLEGFLVPLLAIFGASGMGSDALLAAERWDCFFLRRKSAHWEKRVLFCWISMNTPSRGEFAHSMRLFLHLHIICVGVFAFWLGWRGGLSCLRFRLDTHHKRLQESPNRASRQQEKPCDLSCVRGDLFLRQIYRNKQGCLLPEEPIPTPAILVQSRAYPKHLVCFVHSVFLG